MMSTRRNIIAATIAASSLILSATGDLFARAAPVGQGAQDSDECILQARFNPSQSIAWLDVHRQRAKKSKLTASVSIANVTGLPALMRSRNWVAASFPYASTLGTPGTADVAAYGTAPWSTKSPVPAAGRVELFKLNTSGLVHSKSVISPTPQMFAHFGNIAFLGDDSLAVADRGQQVVLVYALSNLEKRPAVIRNDQANYTFGPGLFLQNGQLYVAARGDFGQRVLCYSRTATNVWRQVCSLARPAVETTAASFGARIVQAGDLLVTSDGGADLGDGGGLLPGAIPVFQRKKKHWRWDGQLTPISDTSGGFARLSPILISNQHVIVLSGSVVHTFNKRSHRWVEIDHRKKSGSGRLPNLESVPRQQGSLGIRVECPQ